MTFTAKRAFTFGRNWRRFLLTYTPERQKIAQDCLLTFLKKPDLNGLSFLDIGCGSGINSAAAFLAGAARIHSFDYDPDSVVATRQLHQHYGSPAHWTVAQGSVLDAAYMQSLGIFDIVYAWGMLHHTGDQWRALANAALPMAPHSLLYIALYAKEAYFNWQYWIDVKRRYNRAAALEKRFMEMHYIWTRILGRDWRKVVTLPTIMRQYKQSRGMEFMTDMRDWLGGWPTEFSSVLEVQGFAETKLKLSLVNLHTGEGNSEFLLAPTAALTAMGYAPIDLTAHYSSLPVLEKPAQLPTQPVWIFGTARGGDLIHDWLIKHRAPIAGFITLDAGETELHRRRVISLADFIAQQPKSTPVILANRYFKANGDRLCDAGFDTLFNGHPLITRLHNNEA